MKFLLLGCGDLGCALATQLLAEGHQVLAVRRNIHALPAGVEGLALDYTAPGALDALSGVAFDCAIFTPTPPGRDADAYRAGFLAPVESLLALWQDGPVREIIHVSSTRVYGDCGGDWVDETTAPRPADAQGELILAAEQAWLQSRHCATVVRFSGIYGRLPSPLLDRIARGELCPAEPLRYSNRIHREDCVGFLHHLLFLESRHDCYLGSDNEPAPQHEVERWLLDALGKPFVTEVTPRMTASRRCDNARLRDSGYELRYPDYRAGYSAMISSTSMATPLGSAAT